MELLDVLVILPGLFVCIVLWWAYTMIDDGVAKRLFCLMVVLFFIPYLFTYPDEVLNEWLHHLPFYIGEVVFYLFLRRLIERYNEEKRSVPLPVSTAPQVLVAVGTIPLERAHSLSSNWFVYATDQGLQHVLTVPLMFLVVSGIRVYLAFVKSEELKHVVTIFLYASIPLMIIHILEFLVERQHLLPVLAGDPLELLEYIWNIVALMIFAYGVGQLQVYTKKIVPAPVPSAL